MTCIFCKSDDGVVHVIVINDTKDDTVDNNHGSCDGGGTHSLRRRWWWLPCLADYRSLVAHEVPANNHMLRCRLDQ